MKPGPMRKTDLDLSDMMRRVRCKEIIVVGEGGALDVDVDVEDVGFRYLVVS